MTREKIGKMAKKITFFRTKEKTMNFAQNSGNINNVNFMNFKIPTKKRYFTLYTMLTENGSKKIFAQWELFFLGCVQAYSRAREALSDKTMNV